MASPAAHRRLTREYVALREATPPFILAKPLETNILEWHYVIIGPPDTPYEGGQYHGKLIFPSEYPYKPPSIWMLTPSGRFQTNARLCLTMSDFHPSLWNPAWSVSTILNGLLSFMATDESTTGSIRSSTFERRLLAIRSQMCNRRSEVFREVWPELCEEELDVGKEKEREKILTLQEQQQQEQEQREGLGGRSGEDGENVGRMAAGTAGFLSGIMKWGMVAVLCGFLLLIRLASGLGS